MILRIRTQVGQWRLSDISPTTTISEVRANLSREHNLDLSDGDDQPITLKPNPRSEEKALPPWSTLESLGIKHGDMVYLRLSNPDMVHEEASGPVKINANGTIQAQTYNEISKKTGFRPGLMSLRSMKMKWTLADFVEMDNQFTFKMERQKELHCTKVSLDTSSCSSFHNLMAQYGYRRSRVGYLYGEFTEDGGVRAEFIYEPPQINAAEGFQLLEDEDEEVVEELARFMHLSKVGWIFAHPPREEGFIFSSAEVLTAAELQLEAAQGLEKSTPFVTVKVTVDKEGKTHFEAFQVSKQAMEMAAEGALYIGENPGHCYINDQFTVIVEGGRTKEVDNSFFLVTAPIEQHDSTKFVSMFPRKNREGNAQTWDAVKKQLAQAGSKGFTYTDLLSDFELLKFLTQLFDMKTDMPKICASVIDRDIPLDEGYILIINSMLGG